MVGSLRKLSWSVVKCHRQLGKRRPYISILQWRDKGTGTEQVAAGSDSNGLTQTDPSLWRGLLESTRHSRLSLTEVSKAGGGRLRLQRTQTDPSP